MARTSQDTVIYTGAWIQAGWSVWDSGVCQAIEKQTHPTRLLAVSLNASLPPFLAPLARNVFTDPLREARGTYANKPVAASPVKLDPHCS